MKLLPEALTAAIAANAGEVAALVEIEMASGALRYTNRDVEVVYDGDTYYPRAMSEPEPRSGVGQMTNEVSIQIDDVDAGALRSAALQKKLTGRPFWLRFCMLDAEGAPIGGDAGVVALFGGRVKSTSVDLQNVTISVESWMGQQKRKIPNENFGPQCRFIFRSTACAYVHADAEKLAQTADAGCSTTVIADAARTEAADWWKNGYIVFTSGACSGEQRRIKASASGSLTLAHALPAAPAAGNLYNVYQWCAKTYADCLTKFSNEDNFGGFVSLAEMDVRT